MEGVVFINETKVKQLLDWSETYEAVKAAMTNVSRKRVVQNARDLTGVLGTNNLLYTMPGYLEDERYGALACKMVTAFPNNDKLDKPLPSVIANITLFDQRTGKLKAVLEATEITNWRTAAASAVATKAIHLRTEEKTCKILAVLGAGAQARSHAIGFYHYFQCDEIRIWNRNAGRAETLVKELNEKVAKGKGVFKSFTSCEECVRNADVIVTATFSTEPFLKLSWVKPGAHINATGTGRELEDALYTTGVVYTDSWSGAKNELGHLEKLGVKIKGEVGEVILGNVGVPSHNTITIFQSLGMAVEDCAMARLIYDKYCREKGLPLYDD